MNARYPEEGEAYRREVRRFLRAQLPADWRGMGALDADEMAGFLKEWRAALYEQRLLAPSWPAEYGGGGLSPLERVIVAEEFAYAGVPAGDPMDDFSIEMLGNTLLEFGSEEQKAHFLPRALSGEHVWCQGFSEPDAGSDLANVKTRAVADGGEWVVNGQKIWTSEGMEANWNFAVVRTSDEERRHRGLSFLLLPMDQPGVEVRRIRMMSGHDNFCETFLTDARTPLEHVVGGVGNGWRTALALLGHERGEQVVSVPIRLEGDLRRLIALAREHGRLDDPGIRRRLAWCRSRVDAMRWLGLRSVTRWLAGGHIGAESSIFKLSWSEYHVVESSLALDVMGEEGLVTWGRRPLLPYLCDWLGAPSSTASWQGSHLISMGGTIYAGTSEIQRNIVGEHILGLPK